MLDQLFRAAQEASERRSKTISETDLRVSIAGARTAINVYRALSPSQNIKLIAEIKRRSPSRGQLATIEDAAELANTYQASGANAISVLTEESGFGGSLADLEAARTSVDIPLLRKDFISTEYQILEARAAGADFILLILAWLKPTDFARLFEFAHDLGMGVLVETHSVEEIELANTQGAKLIGINTRDLQTFKTDIGLFEKMAQRLAPNSIKVAESSVKTLEDVQRYRDAGADVVLVGEALVTGDPAILIPQFVKVA